MDLSGINPTIGSALIELGTSLSTLVLKGNHYSDSGENCIIKK